MMRRAAKADAGQTICSTNKRAPLPHVVAGLVVLDILMSVSPVTALTIEQARENCRASVGRPIVQNCMRSGGGDLETCRTKATPKVHACVQAALNAANGRANVPVAIPTEPAPREPAGKNDKPSPAEPLPVGFVAPPRTITDITAILDNEKPDPKQIDKLKAAADATIPAGGGRVELARFYYDRGNARAQLGRLSESMADANKALEVGRGAVDANVLGRLEQFAGLQYSAAGDPRQALAVFSRQIGETDVRGARGYLFGGFRQISAILIQMGDIDQAEEFLRRNLKLIQEARTSGMPGWRTSYETRGQSWEADVEYNRAIIFEARGQFREAENSYRLAEMRRRASIKGILSSPNPPPETLMLQAADVMVLAQARMKARQGRFAEAEADARRALLARLKDQGKYNPLTPRYIMGLADILVEEGRYPEAEKLLRAAIEINQTVGLAEDSSASVQYLSHLGAVLNLQRRFREAVAVYRKLDNAIAKWDPQRRQVFELNTGRIYSLYAAGQTDAGIAAAQALLKREQGRVGEKHFDTAVAHGTLAMGYLRAGRDADAINEFRAAIPVMMASAREVSDDDDTTAVAARSQRLQRIVEAYIDLLGHGQRSSSDVAVETFSLADAIRGRSVQQALAASSARALAKDPALADLVRQQQDLTKEVNAQLGLLNNVLTLPPAERDEKGIKAIYAQIDRLRADRDKARADIGKRFPNYADLIDPKAPSVDDIKASLKPGEALLSFYFGNDHSFVWAVPKDGPVVFATVAATAGQIETRVRKLREALEPQAATILDIPPFDLAQAYELYGLLLKPVEAGWKPANSLIVVTNGAIGLLPLSLLPTAPAQVTSNAEPLFAEYRGVPWLARTHAVTMVPSAAALRTLRQLPPGSQGREQMIGFGDPIFSKAQADEESQGPAAAPIQVAEATTRGLPLKRRSSPQLDGVDSADLAQLPRLPDTAEELKSIALALEADPSKVLKLGATANERTVKTTDLSKYKIIVFATHGLIPGELNGLTQPALALSAPDVAGVDGDGLLTMEEILALKLDADWVVLSACNTATGAGAGAEAASGLGRAFFYAGTRAILVTNWAVHSASARALVSDLFHRQAADSKMSRAEALRQAMTGLIDGPGYQDEQGKTLFSYAHPLFWAPYTIIGDGG
jgi:CHAT domain-containing protein/tetratricopeptide (TPR) repeat protein